MTDIVSSTTLKPCPFCGNSDCELFYVLIDYTLLNQGAAKIACVVCDAQGPKAGDVYHLGEREQLAIDAWNRREWTGN